MRPRSTFYPAVIPNAQTIQARRQTYAPAGFVPTQYASLQDWFDPFDLGLSPTRRQAAEFTKASSQYLSLADHASLDGASKFTWSFWRQNKTTADAQGYMSKWTNSNGARSWAITAGGGAGEYNKTRIAINTSAVAESFSDVSAPAAFWSHIAIVFDGTLSGDAERLKCYQDGVAVTLTFAGDAIPAALLNATAALHVGGWVYVSAYLNGLLGAVQMWNGRAFTAAEALELFNSGVPIEYDDLSAAQAASVVFALENVVGTWKDRVRDVALTENGGTISLRSMELSRSDRGASGYAYHPVAQNKAVGDRAQTAFCAAPMWYTSAINGRPALRFTPFSNLFHQVPQPIDYGTLDIFEVVQFSSFITPAGAASTESVLFSSGREADHNAYVFTGEYIVAADRTLRMRFKNTDTAIGDASFVSNAVVVADTPYLINWKLKATGDAASAELRVNGVAKTVTPTNGGDGSGLHNKGWDAITNRANLSVGALFTDDPAGSGNFSGYLGERLVYAPGLTTAENLAVEAYLALWWGIDLP